MSFFKEFKEDLKQAVDELIPTEEFLIPQEDTTPTDTVAETVASVMAEAEAQKQLDRSSDFAIPDTFTTSQAVEAKTPVPAEEVIEKGAPVLPDEVYVVPDEVASFVENI